MPDANQTIRTMTRHEVDLAVEWAAREGWNPGLHDADCFFAADPEGFLVGLEHGEPVSCISVVRYGEGFAFLGFYIVRPDRRGRGLGLGIWREGMRRLTGRTVGLDGVADQQVNYRKSGFELAFRNVRQRGTGPGRAWPEAGQGEVVDLSGLPFGQVRAYDRLLFPTGRDAFLRCWLTRPATRALGLMRRGSLAGYGVLRPCREGVKIGPLFADDAAGAETLLSALLEGLGPDVAWYLDTPEANPAALALAERHGLEPVFETARMYRGPAPDMDLDRLFGVTSFELG